MSTNDVLSKLKAEMEKRMHICDGVFERDSDTYYQGKAVAYQETLAFIGSLQQQTDGILNSYIEQRCKELDAIIQEEMTPDNTVTIADKIGAMTAKNELLRIKELI